MLTCWRYIGRLAMLSSLAIRWVRQTGLKGSLSRLLVAAQKLPDPLDYVVLRVDRRHRPGPGQGVAGEEALVQDLAAAKGVTGDIPCQPEELDPLAGFGVVGREILFDIGLQRPREILLARGQKEARRPQQLQDLDHPRIARNP